MRITHTVLALTICASTTFAREPRRSDTVRLASPLDIPFYLAGNFAELRKSHFHSGIDFKTQGRTGLPVRSADDGYISRATVSPWGFGRAVYVTHPETGLTTVYGHLEAFSDDIDIRVRDEQYARETFTIDLSFAPGELPVRRSDIIGLSGNAGSSGGPHLHMDVRDTETGDPLDPLEYYRDRITDNVAPQVRQLAVFPADGGIVDGSVSQPKLLAPENFSADIHAWGRIYPGIKAYDRMTGTNNIYGIKYLTLTLDGDTIYHRVTDRFSFDTTKAIHTLVHYPHVASSGSWIMVTRIPDSDPLPYMTEAQNRGIIDINEERPYRFEWILRDEHGNTTRQPFTVVGQRSPVMAEIANGQLMHWNSENTCETEDYSVTIPEDALYDNAFIDISSSTSADGISRVVTIGDPGIPLDKAFEFAVRLLNDTIADPAKYCLVRTDGKRRSAIASSYADGWIYASPDAFGTFMVTTDTIAPVIRPVAPKQWNGGTLKFRITDNLSGIATYRGEIDGKFALFELDGKTATISFDMDSRRFTKGKDHTVTITVTDACGNETVHSDKFRW
ncbi:MAG: M23 family metallopeptidase [Muribaculaceae bacterium]|nr:M23 family metallopeptidase [Muribaculaceae bacterium]